MDLENDKQINEIETEIPEHILTAYQNAHERVVDAISQSNTTQHLVFQNATYLGSVTAFNFNGVNWTITLNNGVASLAVTGGGGGGGLTAYPVTDGTTNVLSVSMTVVGAIITQTGTAQTPTATMTIPNYNLTTNSNDSTMLITPSTAGNIKTFLVRLNLPAGQANKYFVCFGQGTAASQYQWIALNVTAADNTLVLTNDNAGNITVKINLPTLGTLGQYLTATGNTDTPFAWSNLPGQTPPMTAVTVTTIPTPSATNSNFLYYITGADNGLQSTTVVKGAEIDGGSYLFTNDIIFNNGANWYLVNTEISSLLTNIIIGVGIGNTFTSLNSLNNYLNKRRILQQMTIYITSDIVESVDNININHVDIWNITIQGAFFTEYTATSYTATGNIGNQTVTLTISSATSNIAVGNWIVVYGEDASLGTTDNTNINGNNVGLFRVTAVTGTSISFMNPQNMFRALANTTITLKFKRLVSLSNNNSWLKLNLNVNGLQLGNIAVTSINNLDGNVNTLGLINSQDAQLYLTGILAAGVSSSATSSVNPIGFIGCKIGSDATSTTVVGMCSTAYMETNASGFITTAFGIYQTDIYLASATLSFIAGLGYINNNSRVTIDGSTNTNNYGTVFGSWYVDNGSSLNASHNINCNSQTFGLVSNNNARISIGQLDASSPANANGYYSIIRNNGVTGAWASGSSRMALGTTMRAQSHSSSTDALFLIDQNSNMLLDNVGFVNGIGTITNVGYIDTSNNSASRCVKINSGNFEIINNVNILKGVIRSGLSLGSAIFVDNNGSLKLNSSNQNYLSNNPSNFTGDILINRRSYVYFNNNSQLINLNTLTPAISITNVDTTNNKITFANTNVNLLVNVSIQIDVIVQYYTIIAVDTTSSSGNTILTLREPINGVTTNSQINAYGNQAFLLPLNTSYNNADGLIGGE